MIITCKREVPMRWILFAILPWASVSFQWGVMGVAFIFSLKKFIENPAGLTFIMSLPSMISIVTSPISSFISDRVWTPFGRRKPFILTSWVGAMTCLVLLPLIPNLWTLIAVYIVYNLFMDMGTPVEPLKQEIVPPHQRGRATGAMQWVQNFANLAFFYIALGRFDDVSFLGNFPIDGEQAIYWSAAGITAVMIVLVSLGIKEIDPHSTLRGQRLSVSNFFKGIIDRDLWPVYMLVFGSAMLTSGLGTLGSLLYTDQFGYTKQDMGVNVAIGGVVNMLIIGFLAIFADRLNRMRSYQVLICLAIAFNIFYYAYISFIIPDRRPSLLEMVLFGESLSVIGILTSMVYVPLVYDYVIRNKMGTYVAGASMITRMTQVITLNGVGLFIWGYATLFQPPAGEMVRVVLQRETTKNEIKETLAKADWFYPQSKMAAPGAAVTAQAWYATGLVQEDGQCWEIRLRNADSGALAEGLAELEKKRLPLVVKNKMLMDKVEILQRRNRATDVESLKEESAGVSEKIAALDRQILEVNQKLGERAGTFRDQVQRALGDRIMTEGEQILAVKKCPTLVIELATAQRPSGDRLEKMLDDLRHENPDIIDLRPMKREQGYGVAISALITGTDSEAVRAAVLQKAVERVAQRRQPKLFSGDEAPLNVTRQVATQLELAVVEDPLDTRFSPITRASNYLMGFFDLAPTADRRLTATARSLRLPGESEHVRVVPGPSAHTIAVTAVLTSAPPYSAPVENPVDRRISTFLGKTDEAAQMRIFYNRVVTAGAIQKLTVAQPFVEMRYASMKYDYMSGYIWMFLMGLIGLGITVAFGYREKRGLIRKLGIEEAEKS